MIGNERLKEESNGCSSEEVDVVRLENINQSPLDVPFFALRVLVSVLYLELHPRSFSLNIFLHLHIVLQNNVKQWGKEHIEYDPRIHVVEKGEVNINRNGDEVANRSSIKVWVRFKRSFDQVQKERNCHGDDKEFDETVQLLSFVAKDIRNAKSNRDVGVQDSDYDVQHSSLIN